MSLNGNFQKNSGGCDLKNRDKLKVVQKKSLLKYGIYVCLKVS